MMLGSNIASTGEPGARGSKNSLLLRDETGSGLDGAYLGELCARSFSTSGKYPLLPDRADAGANIGKFSLLAESSSVSYLGSLLRLLNRSGGE